MKIILFGRIPSKKNSKFMARRGDRTYLLPKPEYTAWHEEQSWKIKKLPEPINNVKEVMICFWFPDNRKTDLTNKAESIMDLLVDNKILVDDSWQFVPVLTLVSNGVDKENPRAEVSIVTW